MLLEQVELLKEEHDISVHVHEVEEEQANKKFMRQKDELLNENKRLLREVEIMREAMESKDEDGQTSALNKLLAEIRELKHENTLLRNKLSAKQNGQVKLHFTSFESAIS